MSKGKRLINLENVREPSDYPGKYIQALFDNVFRGTDIDPIEVFMNPGIRDQVHFEEMNDRRIVFHFGPPKVFNDKGWVIPKSGIKDVAPPGQLDSWLWQDNKKSEYELEKYFEDRVKKFISGKIKGTGIANLPLTEGAFSSVHPKLKELAYDKFIEKTNLLIRDLFDVMSAGALGGPCYPVILPHIYSDCSREDVNKKTFNYLFMEFLYPRLEAILPGNVQSWLNRFTQESNNLHLCHSDPELLDLYFDEEGDDLSVALFLPYALRGYPRRAALKQLEYMPDGFVFSDIVSTTSAFYMYPDELLDPKTPKICVNSRQEHTIGEHVEFNGMYYSLEIEIREDKVSHCSVNAPKHSIGILYTGKKE